MNRFENVSVLRLVGRSGGRGLALIVAMGLAAGTVWGQAEAPPAGAGREKPADAAAVEMPALDISMKSEPLEVLSTGSEPRHEIRFSAKAGSVFTATMEMQLTMTQDMGGQTQTIAMPNAITVMTLTCTDVSKTGDMSFTAEVTDARIQPEADTPAMVATAMKRAVEGLKGTRMSMKITPTGQMLESELKMVEGADKNLAGTVDSLRQSMSQMMTMIPSEAMGVGGKWRQVQKMRVSGVATDQTVEFTVSRVDESGTDLEMTMTQSAPEQDMKLPGMAGLGPKVRLVSMSGSNSGTMRIERGLPMAQRVSSRGKTDQTLRMQMGETTSDFKQSMAIVMSIAVEPKDGGAK
jgi:hypothetical protein